MLIKTSNAVIEKYPYSIGELRRDNPQTSFPAKPTDALLAEYGVFPVARTDIPDVDYKKAVKEVDPVRQKARNEDGTWKADSLDTPENEAWEWVQTWVVTDRTAEEIAQIEADQWANIRSERNAKLAACDWTQLPDAPVDTAAWALYRQQLRDITEQPDPFAIAWPQEPTV